MTEENLKKANELKEKIVLYNNYINMFRPIPEPVVEEVIEDPNNPYPALPIVRTPTMQLVANYFPGTINSEGVITAGKWEVDSGYTGSINNNEIMEIINSVASSELSNIGYNIVQLILEKITTSQTEFNLL